VTANAKVLYAAAEDFEQLFAKQNTDLFRLSLHLTADAERADRCLILAMRDCFFRSNVLKDRVDTWARRMVVRNAIRLVWGTPNDILGESGFEFHSQPSCYSLEALRESVAILTLPDLDRVAFVICILERYSILDCALLLRKAPREVYDAIVRATSQILPLEEPKDHEAAVASPCNSCGVFWSQGNNGHFRW
jgi:DNA-directed RNA polymerase specialized sigma24 family protein